MVKRNTRSNN